MTDQEALARIIDVLLDLDGPPIMQASMNGYEERLARWHKSARDMATKRATAILAALPTLDYVKSTRVKELEANQRTPGTAEVCSGKRCNRFIDSVNDGCDKADCPIRTEGVT